MIAKIIITLLVVLVGYMFYKNSNAPSYLKCSVFIFPENENKLNLVLSITNSFY